MKINPCVVKTVWADQASLAQAVAHMVVIESKKAIAEKGFFTLALSGGNTPALLYELLATAPYKNNVDWTKTIVAFGDERFVPPTSKESNYKMAKEILFEKVPLPGKNIFSIKTIQVTPAQSAKEYGIALKKYISRAQPFDLVLLGIGDEGHTASIFPGSALITSKRNVESVWVTEKNMERISFTLPFINQAKNVAFLVSGTGKAAIIKKIFSKKNTGLPAALVSARSITYWFLDHAANGS